MKIYDTNFILFIYYKKIIHLNYFDKNFYYCSRFSRKAFIWMSFYVSKESLLILDESCMIRAIYKNHMYDEKFFRIYL